MSTTARAELLASVEDASEEALIELAFSRDIPLVATNPATFAEPGFHAAHDAMLCIAGSTYVENSERPTSSPEAWLKPAATMEQLFADLPEAIANTGVVAQRCAVAAPKRRPILPRLSEDEDETLRREAHAGLEAAKGDDLGHTVAAVLGLDVGDDLVAMGFAEIDVEVGH